jgi:hypothetical protein
VGEGQALLGQFDVHAFEVDDVESLIVLLYGGFDDYLLLFRVNFKLVDLLRVGQVTDAPLKTIQCVLPQKYRLFQALSTVIDDFTSSSLLPFSSSSPISYSHFVSLN